MKSLRLTLLFAAFAITLGLQAQQPLEQPTFLIDTLLKQDFESARIGCSR